jgi:spermidine synthase
VAETIDRRTGSAGELALRRDGEHYEIIANGVFLMDTRGGSSERLLVTAAADRMPPGERVLIAGLGVGFSLRAALDHPAVGSVVVVEREPAVIEWNHGPLRAQHGDALADPRVTCVPADFVAWLGQTDDRYGAICLDIDNGPEWTVSPENAGLYTEASLTALARRLVAGGVLAVWSATASEPFATRLRGVFEQVDAVPVAVPRGEPDVVYLGYSPR